MNIDVAKKRINQVLRIDSIDSTDGDFLATHVPLRKIVVNTRLGGRFEETGCSEEDIYKDIFENENTRNEHQFIIVEGSSGAGKSHFIRWLYAKLSANEEISDAVLLIRRSDNTLKGTIRQLLEINEIKQIANKESYERLVRANQTISENKFKSTIYHSFIVEIENDTSETLSRTKQGKLVALLNNAVFRDRLMSAGGPIDRIYNKITGASYNADRDQTAQFTSADLTLDIEFVEQQLDDADKKARDFANSLVEDGDNEFIQKITDYLNSFVETVIQTSAGIEPGDFQQIFKEIRQELKRQGKSLILLVEDITSFTGVNQALLNALVTGHTGTNSADNICKLISVVGTTSEYYRQFRDNYRDRITKQITIHEGAVGDNKNDLIQFVAKYLNAVSIDSEILDEWVRNGAYTDEMPVHEDSGHEHWDSFTLASKKKISLFPFTKQAILNLYSAMSSQKTPRYILRDIVEPALNEIIYNTSLFPRFCIGWRSALPETVENRIGNIVASLKIPDDQKAEYRKRLIAFMSFWTDKTLDVTDNGCIAGIKTKVFMELAFGDFVAHLTSTASVKTADFNLSNSDIEESSYVPETAAIPDKTAFHDNPSIDPKRQKAYDSFKENVVAWYHDGGKLIRFQPVRDQICNFIYNSINWQQEGVSLECKIRFQDSIGNRFIGFERQDQGLDKCIIIFPGSDETYQLLLCFGKWIHLGNNSWDFPDAASAVYRVTSWLERNKDKFVNAVRNNGKNVIPAYIKAAMLEQVYKKILNGTIGKIKLNRIGDETFLTKEHPKNESLKFSSGHSKSWYELHSFIYNDRSNSESYTSSVRYFNLIQGMQGNSSNYVLDYSLYKKAIKEIRESGFKIEENELNEIDSIVKSKREIFELASKTYSKLRKVVQEEAEKARLTAAEILSYFENIDMEDDIEPSDVRDILNDALDFYQKAFEAGVNICNRQGDIAKMKKGADTLASAINILQADYSDEDDVKVLLAFSSNPIGVAMPFLDLLKTIDADVTETEKIMKNEREALTNKGGWTNSTDPRFELRRDKFNALYKAFEEV